VERQRVRRPERAESKVSHGAVPGLQLTVRCS